MLHIIEALTYDSFHNFSTDDTPMIRKMWMLRLIQSRNLFDVNFNALEGTQSGK